MIRALWMQVEDGVKMRSAKIPIPAASGRGITEFSLRVALPQKPFLRPKGRGINPQRLKSRIRRQLPAAAALQDAMEAVVKKAVPLP